MPPLSILFYKIFEKWTFLYHSTPEIEQMQKNI